MMLRRYALFALFPLHACASNGLHPLKPLEIATSPYQDLAASSVTGSLMYENGCLLFREEGTKAHFLPVWPDGSTFNGTAVMFHQPAKADERVVLGEEFLMEGRPVEWTAIQSDYFAPFEHQCGAKPFYVSGVRPAD